MFAKSDFKIPRNHAEMGVKSIKLKICQKVAFLAILGHYVIK